MCEQRNECIKECQHEVVEADSTLHRILSRGTNVIYNAQGIPISTTILAEVRVNSSIHNGILRVGGDTRLVC